MFVTMNRIFVTPDFAGQFEDNFRNRAKEVDKMPGFIRNAVLRPKGEDQPYVVQTFWESEAAFREWVGSDAFKKGHARSGTLPPEAFAKKGSLETYEVFLDTEN